MQCLLHLTRGVVFSCTLCQGLKKSHQSRSCHVDVCGRVWCVLRVRRWWDKPGAFIRHTTRTLRMLTCVALARRRVLKLHQQRISPPKRSEASSCKWSLLQETFALCAFARWHLSIRIQMLRVQVRFTDTYSRTNMTWVQVDMNMKTTHLLASLHSASFTNIINGRSLVAKTFWFTLPKCVNKSMITSHALSPSELIEGYRWYLNAPGWMLWDLCGKCS